MVQMTNCGSDCCLVEMDMATLLMKQCLSCPSLDAIDQPLPTNRQIAPTRAPITDSNALISIRQRFLKEGMAPREIPLPILRSWQRSAASGINLEKRPSPAFPQREDILRFLDENEDLVQAAWGEVEALSREMRESGGAVILTDANGVLLMRVGSADFAEEADRIALHPGAHWGETSFGTNAIGAALAEGRPISVIGGEHFLTAHSAVSCSAAPILDPAGKIVGVLDLSTGSHVPHCHSLALLQRSVDQIERRLFEQRHAQSERMHIHPNPYILGSPHEGIVAFEDDILVGANRNAMDLLGLTWQDIGVTRFSQIFSLQRPNMDGRAGADDIIIQTARGSTLFARIEKPLRPLNERPNPAAARAAKICAHRYDEQPQIQDTVERLLAGAMPGTYKVRRFKSGHLIYGSDEIDDGEESILIMRSGQLRCFSSFEGRELTLFTLNGGDALSLRAETLLEVKKDCEFLTLRNSNFRRLAYEDPDLALAVMPVIERMLQRSIRMNEAMAFHSVRHRLVRALCDAVDREGRRTRQGVILDTAPNAEDLAMQIGAVRQSVSTALADLIRGGIIQRLGANAMIVPNVKRLRAELDLIK
ncbi:GAF domain-containing protein [Consotaella salsifontis]|uniref:GAF domain-containing protein n=2 Tax=Consotaella salsifontis TaxID=1365950 RepID=A0A1T4SIL0_9HYPH|nr:GAF domain-containing protein [Consotaella salsifontis]